MNKVSVMPQFLEFYWNVIWRVPRLAWDSFVTVEGIFATLIIIAGYFAGSEAIKHWTDIKVNKPKLALLIVVIYFAYLLLESNYQEFRSQASTHSKVVKAFGEKLNKAMRANDTQTILIDHLTKQNAALQTEGRVLSDAQARIEAIRNGMLAHLEKAPTKEAFTAELGHDWYIVAQAMRERSVSFDSDLLVMHFDKERGTYEQFLETIGTFRAMAMNLTEEDLVDNTPDRSR